MNAMKTAWTSALACTLMAAAMGAHAETKKELVQKLLVVQQPGLEATARSMSENSVRGLAGQAQNVLAQAVPEDKREATAKAIDGEIRKYLESVTPIIRTSALKFNQSMIGPMFEEKLTEDELKQLVAMLESPVLKKYQSLMPEINTVFEKVVQDTRPQIEPKLQGTQQSIRKILDTATGGKLSGGAPSQPAPATAAKPAPAKK